MRWLLIGLLISVGALLYVAVAATRHVLRQRRAQAGRARDKRSGQNVPELAESNEAAEYGGALDDETQVDKNAAGRGSN